MFVDAHCHLTFPDFDSDRHDVIERLKAQNVGLLIHPGTDVERSEDAIRFAESFDFAYANVGLHPSEVSAFGDEAFATLDALGGHEKVVAIGEIGLDYHYPDTDRKRQEMCFREMLRIAKRRDLPVVIHSRDAWDDMFKILKEESHSGLRGMMHCFTGTIEEAQKSLSFGLKISIPGIVTFKKSPLPEVVSKLDLSDLLTETDCPYLAPAPYRGKRNEPAYVVEIAKKIAEIKEIPAWQVEETIEKTTRRLFGI
ncbi:MAG: TatD family hydrolase [Chlorobiales bacterium]|nr:TatD family hydrolase [Chlorobiales bacterium]